MSTSKHIDVICVVVIVLSVLLTVLFMNGKKLGIEPILDEDAADAYFSDNDLNGAWDTANATQILLQGDSATVRGNGAYFSEGKVHIVYAGRYVLSGSLEDGSVLIDADADDKIWLCLNGASVACDTDAPIRIEQADKVFMTLAEGTENTIAGGENYAEDLIADGVDGAIYSRDDLTINGSGSLTVNAAYCHGIVCNDDLVIAGGKITVDAKEDTIHANDSVRMRDMQLSLSAGDDGITVSNDDDTAYIYMHSGSVQIDECYEGLESITVTIAGGDVQIHASDDGINANGNSENSLIQITGGNVTVLNSDGRDADGLDSNGDIHIEGGTVFISLLGDGSNCALDCGSESGGKCVIDGGTVIACGGASMAESFDDTSSQCSFMYNPTTSAQENAALLLTDADGTVLVEQPVPYRFSSVVISTPELKQGGVYTLSVNDEQTQITMDSVSVMLGNAGMGGFGGMGGGMGRQRSESFTGEESSGFDGGGMMRGNREDMTGEDNSNAFARGGMFRPFDESATGENGSAFRGGFGDRGERPSMPDGEMPSMPDGEMPSMPEGNRIGNDKGMRSGESMSESATDLSDQTNAAADPQVWLLVGISTAVLLVGICLAWKYKKRFI